MLERKYIESFLTGSMRNMALFFSAAGRPVCRLCMQSQLFNHTCILCDTIYGSWSSRLPSGKPIASLI